MRQLRVLKLAYQTETPAEPWLPPPGSALPALLALRNTDNCIRETRECIAKTETDLSASARRLENEKAHLDETKLIQDALSSRIASLQVQIADQTQKSPAAIAKEMMRELDEKRASYETETKTLVAAFNEFVEEHLAVMLAAEELGGPIVGQELDVDEDMLQGGFSAQGKPKRAKAGLTEDKRQRRIDEIWGEGPAVDDQGPWDERRAAAADMRDLTEQLLNSMIGIEDGGPGGYVELPRESAAARFLVRSKIAQFHPRDARKIRLLDFGGELDD